MRTFTLLICFWLVAISALGQARINKLSPIINHPSINVSAPFVSLDGNSLLFVSDNAEDNALGVFYTTKADGINWKEPVLLPRNIHSRLNFLRGFALSSDGRQLYITSMKSGGLGGYDLFISDLKGTIWSEPANVGQPANSPGHEGCPSFTTDGLTMYFMRCTKMDMMKAEGCKILVSKRKTVTDRWGAPEELPSYINTGNSQAPRIMGDAETLVFSSDQLSPNKGGMDLFLSRLEANGWSKPVPLDFANSAQDDQFVSGSSLGRYLMKDAPGKSKSEIVEVLFPPDLKPKGVMKVEGKVTGPENPAAAYLSVFDKKTQTRLYNLRPSPQGTFTLYLKEGIIYQINADPEQDQFTFASKDFDLTQGKFNLQERLTLELKRLKPGDEMELINTRFKMYSAELEPAAQAELRKLVRLMNGYPSLNFTIEVALLGYKEDSLRNDPDLTEVQVDSVRFPITREYVDSIAVDPVTGDTSELVRTETYDSIVARTWYHNDRTPHMVLELVNYLVSQGIAAGRLTPTHRRDPAVLPERKTLIKVIAR